MVLIVVEVEHEDCWGLKMLMTLGNGRIRIVKRLDARSVSRSSESST